MNTKAERRAAREQVAAYHEARQGELVAAVGEAVDRFRTGELGAFEVDEVIHQYHRAARQLWVFCDQSGAHAVVGAVSGHWLEVAVSTRWRRAVRVLVVAAVLVLWVRQQVEADLLTDRWPPGAVT
ncbi:hypothetical protein [Nocardia sputi]|uniref:hypothetical protein n=1 Tax=Nocardia sputi TaxID=2943705 RepID=UPI0020BD5BBE|nr:hypothetical protein [Nocardia sputi]